MPVATQSLTHCLSNNVVKQTRKEETALYNSRSERDIQGFPFVRTDCRVSDQCTSKNLKSLSGIPSG